MTSTVRDPATEAFSLQSPEFDAIDAGNPLIGWVRERVRDQALEPMQRGDSLLELNAGTGIDSVYFAEQGMLVLATDAASGMIEQLEAKARKHPELTLAVQHCSFLDLDQLGGRKFHHVFSNFGGLNCTDRLDLVLKGFDRVLRPGGTCTLVLMPRTSPWELITVLKGNFALAFRRWRKNGTPALVEGITFPCFYYAPSYVRHHLGTGYKVTAQRALSILVPPPYHERFPARWPRTFSVLSWLEDRISAFPILRNWGDHFVITLQKPDE